MTPATVEVGEKFTIGIETNPEPAVGIAGFGAEVLVPKPGLAYNGAFNCAAEVKVTVSGGAPGLCQSVTTAADSATVDAHGLAVLSQVQAAPIALFDGSPGIVGLANLSYTCNAAGVYAVTLTSQPTSADGAAYSDADLNLIFVKSDPSDTASITCLPESGLISIAKTDTDTGDALGGTHTGKVQPKPGGADLELVQIGNQFRGLVRHGGRHHKCIFAGLHLQKCRMTGKEGDTRGKDMKDGAFPAVRRNSPANAAPPGRRQAVRSSCSMSPV